MGRRVVFNCVVCVLLILGSCLPEPETAVDPSLYFTSYQIYYHEPEQRTSVLAVFTAIDRDGFRQILQGNASVNFRSKNLQYNPDLTEYSLSFDDYITDGTFIYTDQNGRKFSNSISNKLIGFPQGLDTVDVRNDLEFYWKGDPLDDDELVSLQLEDPVLGFSELFQEHERGATKITIPRNDLARFGQGTIVMLLAREKVKNATEDPGVGGGVNSVYFTSKEVVFN